MTLSCHNIDFSAMNIRAHEVIDKTTLKIKWTKNTLKTKDIEARTFLSSNFCSALRVEHSHIWQNYIGNICCPILHFLPHFSRLYP